MDELRPKDRLELYRNYLFALQTRSEYGNRYGDTDELIEMYEDKLNIKVKALNKVIKPPNKPIHED